MQSQELRNKNTNKLTKSGENHDEENINNQCLCRLWQNMTGKNIRSNVDREH